MQSKGSDKTEKIRERTDILTQMVVALQPIYSNYETTEYQKQFIETTIGAALWYIPTGREAWSGKISVACVQAHHPDNEGKELKMSQEHDFPRKIAALELLSTEWASLDAAKHEVFDRYMCKYGRYHYITPRENKLLVKFQKKAVFTDPGAAHMEAGIILLDISKEEHKGIAARDRATIERIIGRLSSK